MPKDLDPRAPLRRGLFVQARQHKSCWVTVLRCSKHATGILSRKKGGDDGFSYRFFMDANYRASKNLRHPRNLQARTTANSSPSQTHFWR